MLFLYSSNLRKCQVWFKNEERRRKRYWIWTDLLYKNNIGYSQSLLYPPCMPIEQKQQAHLNIRPGIGSPGSRDFRTMAEVRILTHTHTLAASPPNHTLHNVIYMLSYQPFKGTINEISRNPIIKEQSGMSDLQ